MKKNVWLILTALLLLSLVAACGGESPASEEPAAAAPTATSVPTTTPVPTAVPAEEGEQHPVTVWFHSGQGAEREALEAAIESFHSSQNAYSVEAVQLPEGSYTDQVNAAALADDLPCLLDFDGPLLYNFAWSGFLQPIDQFISADMKADFLPSIIDQGTYNGQLYSLGQFDSGLAIYGNKSYLEAAGVRIPTIDDPWTWPSLRRRWKS